MSAQARVLNPLPPLTPVPSPRAPRRSRALASAVGLLALGGSVLGACSSSDPEISASTTTKAKTAVTTAKPGATPTSKKPPTAQCVDVGWFNFFAVAAVTGKNATANTENDLKTWAAKAKTAAPELASAIDARVVYATKKLKKQEPTATETADNDKGTATIQDYNEKNCGVKIPETTTTGPGATTTVKK